MSTTYLSNIKRIKDNGIAICTSLGKRQTWILWSEMVNSCFSLKVEKILTSSPTITMDGQNYPKIFSVRFHNIEFDLINSSVTRPVGQKKANDYVNYFIGNDQSKWAGGVKQFGEVRMPNVYPNVDFFMSSIGSHMKYEFRLASGADLNDIKFKISGADGFISRR